ncbi:MAG: methyltransferase [Gemmatimonadetes bacterium]|nr:methyltransferase [Gemmatimonadota bacterium]
MTINNVSDTARWVAVYRAMETARPDAIFKDPYAARLAGEQGEKIVTEMKQGRAMAWAMITRTAVMDEIILDRVKNAGVDTVLNLAAGLDARAWRLPLPASLHWIDVDLPAMSEYKSEHMKGETPVCRYEAIPVDLTNSAVREALFRTIGTSATSMLVITEGLLIYLEQSEVESLARAIHSMPSARWWLSDIASPTLLKVMERSWKKALEEGNAPFKFSPVDSAAFFAPLGWREIVFKSAMVEARRLKREMRMMWLWRIIGSVTMSAAKKKELERISGVILLERT